MKKIISSLFIISLLYNSYGQENIKPDLSIFKTYDDFFNGKKTFIENYSYFDEDKLEYIDKVTGKKIKTKISDSTVFAIEYRRQIGGYVKKIKNGKYDFILFGGGNKYIYCVMGGTYATYDTEGYIQELFWQDWFEIYYTDKINNIISSKNIEDLLKNKPNLLEKYLNEKRESDRKAWKRNKVINEMRYLKLYIKEYSK